jgi:hypothetical protein
VQGQRAQVIATQRQDIEGVELHLVVVLARRFIRSPSEQQDVVEGMPHRNEPVQENLRPFRVQGGRV